MITGDCDRAANNLPAMHCDRCRRKSGSSRKFVRLGGSADQEWITKGEFVVAVFFVKPPYAMHLGATPIKLVLRAEFAERNGQLVRPRQPL